MNINNLSLIGNTGIEEIFLQLSSEGESLPVKQIGFKINDPTITWADIIWDNWSVEESISPRVIVPNYFFNIFAPTWIRAAFYDSPTTTLNIWSQGTVVNGYWNNTNVFKEIFVGIWGYASDSFYPTNYYEYFNSFYNSFEDTWDLVRASTLQVDLSEVNGILDTNEFSIGETKEFWVSWKSSSNTYLYTFCTEYPWLPSSYEGVDIEGTHIYSAKDIESTYYIATAVSNTTITVDAVTYTRDVYEYLEPRTQIHAYSSGQSLPGTNPVRLIKVDSQGNPIGPYIEMYGNFLNLKFNTNTSNEARSGRINFIVNFNLIPRKIEYYPRLFNPHIIPSWGWTNINGNISKHLFTLKKFPNIDGENVFLSLEEKYITVNKDFAYKNVYATSGVEGETMLPLYWDVTNFDEVNSMYETAWGRTSHYNFEQNEFEITNYAENTITVDNVIYNRNPNMDSLSISTLDGLHFTVKNFFYISKLPPITFSIDLYQLPRIGACTTTHLTTTGDSIYWRISPILNTLHYDGDLVLIENIAYRHFSINDKIELYFENAFVSSITFTPSPYDPDGDNLYWEGWNRYPATERKIISNGTGIRITNLVEEFDSIYYIVRFTNGHMIILGLIKSEYTEAPIINQIGTENLTYDGATGTYSIDLVMEIQKNTVTQKVWFTYNNSDLNPEDRHFATLTEYDTYYKGTLHIDYLTTGTQYFYQGYAGNAYGEDVETVHNFFTPPTPAIQAVSNISYTTATFNGSVLGTVSSYGFKYNKKSTPANIITVNSTNLSEGGFSYSETGLSEDTEYEIVSFACNSGGCNDSPNKLTFKTLRRPAIVITNDATNITYNSAVISASFTKGTYDVIAAGFEWGITDSIDSEDIPCTIVGNTFSTTLTNLVDNKTYYYRGYVIDNQPTSNKDVGNVIKNFITEPNVITYTITVSPNTASYNYIEESKQFTVTPKKFINGNESAESIEWLHSVTSDADGLVKTISSNPSSQLGTSTVTITSNSNINANNTSSEERYAGIIFSIVGSSSTTANLSLEQIGIQKPAITLSTPTANNCYSITVSGTIYIGDGVLDTSDYGIRISLYNTMSSFTYQKCTNYNSSNGSYSYTFDNLSPSTTYYFQGYAKNTAGLYGESTVVSKITSPAPSVTTLAATSIGHHTATLNGSYNLTSSGVGVNSIGFEWTINEVLGFTHDETVVGTSTPFHLDVSGLASGDNGTTYYFRAYIVDSIKGIRYYGTVLNFTTDADVITYTVTVSPNEWEFPYSGGSSNAKTFIVTPKKFVNDIESAAVVNWDSVVIDGSDLIYSISPSSGTGQKNVTITANSNISGSNETTDTKNAVVKFRANSSDTYYATLQLSQEGIFIPYTTISSVVVNNCYQITVSCTVSMYGIDFGVNGYGIQYSTSSSFLSPTYQKCTNLNGTTYSYVFTSLSPNTTYYFRAYAQNIESLYGVSTISSGTTPAAPTVTTSSATLIDHHTARLNGSYNMGSSGMTINTIGFEWGQNKYDLNLDGNVLSTTSPFYLDISNLQSGESGTTYYFRAYITDQNNHTYYSHINENTFPYFTTDADVITYTVTVTPNTWQYHYTASNKTFSINPKKFINGIGSAEVVNWNYNLTDAGDLVDTITPTQGSGITNVTITANSNISSTNQSTDDRYAGVDFYVTAASSFKGSLSLSQIGIIKPSTAVTTATVNTCYRITITCTVDMYGIDFGTNRYGIEYSTSSVFSSYTYQKCTNLNSGTYSYSFTGLNPNTTYYFRAYAQNKEGLYHQSSSVSRKTYPAPTVTTGSVTSIAQNSATLGGSYNVGTSGVTVTTVGFEWGTTIDMAHEDDFSAVTPFSLGITSLISDTIYYYRAYIYDSEGVRHEGTRLSFSTLEDVITYSISINDTYEEFGYSGGSKSLTLTIQKFINGVFNTNSVAWSTSIIDPDDAITNINKPNGTGNVIASNPIIISIGSNVSSNNTSTSTRYASVTFYVVNDSGTSTEFNISQDGIQVPSASIYNINIDGTTQITVTGTADFKGEYAYYYAIYSSTSSGGSYLPTEGSNWNSSTKLFSVVFSGLDAETTYYFKAFAENLAGLTDISSYSSGTTYGIPAVVEMKSSSATSSSLSLSAEFISRGSSTITECGFIVGTASTLVGGTTYSVSVPVGVEVYNKTISSGISDGTKYYFQAYATNGAGTSYSSIDNITTPVAITVPSFSSFIVTALGQTSLEVEAYINNGGATITSGRIYYKRAVDSSYSYVTRSMSNGAFSSSLTGLQVGTNYYVYLWAQNSVGSGTSNTRQEETDPAVAPSVALLLDAEDHPVNSADENTITLYGNLISDGGSSITSWGFRYSLSINGSNQLVAPITTASITSGTAFEKLIEELSYDTTYYYQAYATNSIGTGYSLVSNVTTEEQVFPTYTIELTVEGTGEGNYLYYYATITSGGPAQSSINISISQFKTYTNIQGTLGESTKSSSKSLTIGVGSYTTSISTGILQGSSMRSGKVTTYSTIINVTFTTPLSTFFIELPGL